jgi:RimJ/RimL family protein N-acetyltransferase
MSLLRKRLTPSTMENSQKWLAIFKKHVELCKAIPIVPLNIHIEISVMPQYELVDVYDNLDEAMGILFRLLQEREEWVNISHKSLPMWENHVNFVRSMPYYSWHLILEKNDTKFVGAIYFTNQREFGVFILKDHRGKGAGTWAVRELMARHGEGRYVANINPKNYQSIEFFRKLGFKGPIQFTFELDHLTS